jgi:hypothetical protein
MLEIYRWLSDVAAFSEFVPLIILFRIKGIQEEKLFLTLLDFSLIKVFVWFFSYPIIYFNFWDKSLNYLVQNIYTIFSFFLITELFRTLLIGYFSKLFRIGNIIFLSTLLINCIWFDFRYHFLNYTTAVCNLVFVAYGITFALRNKSIEPSRDFNKYIYLNTSILIYHAGMFPVMCFDRILFADKCLIPQQLIWSIVLLSLLFSNFLISVFLVEYRILKPKE